jgi:hypothetical protein
LVGIPEGRDRLEGLGLDGKIILKKILKKTSRSEYVDWIYVAQDMEQWRTLANMIMNFLVSITCFQILGYLNKYLHLKNSAPVS